MATEQGSEEEYLLLPNVQMVGLMVEEAHDIIEQYSLDRTEYASEEIYNYWIKGGRRAIILQVINWLENELELSTTRDEGECAHGRDPQACALCLKREALIAKYAEYRDDSMPSDDIGYDQAMFEQDIIMAAGRAAPVTQDKATAILCACGSGQPIYATCGICLGSTCPSCIEKHGPGNCH